MNPKIKELWNKAADLESDDSWESQTRFMERFAELIVRECASVVDRDMDRAEPIWCSDKILKHFGVE